MTNNSLEAGNNVLKNFFSRPAQNIKVFLGKMRDFFVENVTQQKLAVAKLPQFKEKPKI
jgi:hypothetical protein